MGTVDEVIHDALIHYSDKFYDPQKAHDYYVRTRQLHPRQASIKGPAQTQALSYATHQIQEAKKAQLAALKKQHDAQIKHILDSLKAWVDAQAARLNHPPPGLTGKQLHAWVANEKMQMRRVRREAATKIQAAISAARVNYANAVKGVNANYTKTVATERANISTHVPVPATPSRLKGHHKTGGHHKRGKKSKTQSGVYVVGQQGASSKKQSGVYTVGS